VVKHLGRVVEKDGKEKLIPSQLKFDSVDHAYPVGELALFWKVAEEFEIQKSISKAIGRDDKDTSMAILILAINQLIGRKSLTKIGGWVSETPIPRWTNIDQNKLNKDYFLSALDRILPEYDGMVINLYGLKMDMELKLADRILDLDWSYQKTATCQ
jgi:hypothetical protein